MSLGVRRILVVCVALVGCEPPAPTPEAPVAAAARPAPSAPVKAAPAPEPAEPEEPVVKPRPVKPEIEKAVARGINELTIDLQRKLTKQPGNLAFSTMSIATALAMVHAGSKGKTAKELGEVLYFAEPAKDMHAGFGALAARWARGDGNVDVARASRLFGDPKLAFVSDYVDLTRTVFGAPPEPLDMAKDPEAARAQVNTWVRERTRERVPEVIPEGAIGAKTRLVLADAVDFKGEWLDPFDPAATAPMTFFAPEGKREVPMMRTVLRLPVAFGKAGKLRVLELPYKGGDYSMVIVLPAKRGGLAEIEKWYDMEKLQSWLDAAKPTAVDLRLPRFTLDSSIDLTPVVAKLGAGKLFDSRRADLTGMIDGKVALSGIHHRTRITVEERAKEADPTAIVVSVGSTPANPVPFFVDRPFLFYIRDVRTGALLFFGRVMDPT